MVTTNTMAIATTRSTLELMLDKIQQVDNQAKDGLPALPVRPVSRARLPRSRRPLPNELPRTMPEENYVEASEIAKQKATSRIQKWYRGYKARCQYKELRKGVILLQSFVRGENARRNYEHRTRLISQDCVKVPYNVLVDLQKHVVRTEAKVRGKNEENIALKTQLKDMDMKWQQYEERMKHMEKKWQDELIYIQKRLAASKKNQRYSPKEDTNCILLPGNTNGSSQVDECRLLYNEDSNKSSQEQVCNNLHPGEELRKVKLRFKEWKKDYKNKLKETQLALKKLGSSETSKIQKHWWGRLL